MQNKKSSGRTILAHAVLIILAFMCLFFFYILIINATRSHAQLQLGFSALPGSSLITNLMNVLNDPAIPIVKGIMNSLFLAVAVTVVQNYFTMMAAYAFSKFDFKGKNFLFSVILVAMMLPGSRVMTAESSWMISGML